MGEVMDAKEMLKMINSIYGKHHFKEMLDEYEIDINDFEIDINDFEIYFGGKKNEPKVLKNGIPENWDNETTL